MQNAVQTHLSNASRFRRCGLLLARKRSRKRGLPRPPPRVPSQDSYRPIRKKASSSVVGKKRVTRSTQAATKSAKSGGRSVRKNASFRRWQEKRVTRSTQTAIKSAKSGGRPVGKNALFRRCLARCAATYCCSFESAVNTIVYRTPMEYKPSFVVLLFCRSCLCVTTSLFWSSDVRSYLLRNRASPIPAPLTWRRVSQKTLWLSRYTGI